LETIIALKKAGWQWDAKSVNCDPPRETISAPIRGLNEAAKLDALLRLPDKNSGATAYLAQQCEEIFEALKSFGQDPRGGIAVVEICFQRGSPS
jgi:hypothetical protein